jgi:hypothetical protein
VLFGNVFARITYVAKYEPDVVEYDILGYVNGVYVMSWHANGHSPLRLGSDLRLLRDEDGNTDEDSAAAVSWIRVYDGAMTVDEVAAGGGPQPLTCAPPDQTPPADTPPDQLPVPPDTAIATHPDAKTKSKQAQFSFTSNTAGATFECSLDGEPFSGCVSPSILPVGKGAHNFQVRAVAGGLTDQSPATYGWVVKSKPKHHHHHHHH